MTVKIFHLSSLLSTFRERYFPALRPTVDSSEEPTRRGMRSMAMATLVVVAGLSAVTIATAKEKPKPTGDWKPRIHFYAGPAWNNDPNGPILLNGIYHLFSRPIPTQTFGAT